MAKRNETKWIVWSTNVWDEWAIKKERENEKYYLTKYIEDATAKKEEINNNRMLMNWSWARWFITHYVTSAKHYFSNIFSVYWMHFCTYVRESDDLLEFDSIRPFLRAQACYRMVVVCFFCFFFFFFFLVRIFFQLDGWNVWTVQRFGITNVSK